MHQGKAVFRVGILGMGRGVTCVATRKAPDGTNSAPLAGAKNGAEG